MVGTDARASSAYVNSDSAKRAIDGALQLGIGQVKAVNSGSLANTVSPCTGFPSNSQVTIEGRTLDIACADADPTLPAPRSAAAADSADTSAVLLLRDGWDSSAIVTDAYSQSWEQVFSFGPLCQNLRIGPLVTCINEKLGLTLESLTKILQDCRNGNIFDRALCPIKVVWRVLSGGSGLMHVGDEPLQVYGNVDVPKWGLASAFSPSSASGLKVTNGVYRQGVADGSCSATVLTELGNLVPSRTGVVSASSSCDPVAAPALPTPPTPTTQVERWHRPHRPRRLRRRQGPGPERTVQGGGVHQRHLLVQARRLFLRRCVALRQRGAQLQQRHVQLRLRRTPRLGDHGSRARFCLPRVVQPQRGWRVDRARSDDLDHPQRRSRFDLWLDLADGRAGGARAGDADREP
jgi:hypothetical protein